jgi:hypothetical protein
MAVSEMRTWEHQLASSYTGRSSRPASWSGRVFVISPFIGCRVLMLPQVMPLSVELMRVTRASVHSGPYSRAKKRWTIPSLPVNSTGFPTAMPGRSTMVRDADHLSPFQDDATMRESGAVS